MRRNLAAWYQSMELRKKGGLSFMNTQRSHSLLVAALVGGAVIVCASCATVPKEVVVLSHQVGEDQAAVHESYKILIKAYVGSLKNARLQYLTEEFTPMYIESWIEDGRLRDIVKGSVVWSEDTGNFVKPTPGREDEELRRSLLMWSQSMVDELEDKKAELMTPLDSSEAQLDSLVDAAFNRLYRGNAFITAHLNSLREVQEVQDSFLSALGIKDLRDKINDGLIRVSVDAQRGLELVRRADQETRKAKSVR